MLVDALFSSGQQNGITVRDFGGGDYGPVISTFSTTHWNPRCRASSVAAEFGGCPGRWRRSRDGTIHGAWEVMLDPDLRRNSRSDSLEPFPIGYNGEHLEDATYLG